MSIGGPRGPKLHFQIRTKPPKKGQFLKQIDKNMKLISRRPSTKR